MPFLSRVAWFQDWAERSRPLLVAAVIALPLQDTGAWKQEKYSKITPSQVSFSPEGMLVRVESSASPLVYPILPAKRISGFRVAGEFQGLPIIKGAQGQKGFDDYALRIGFVIPGEKKLSGLQKLFAPAWVKNLYASVPAGAGIEGVRFFNVTQTKAQLGQKREHPKFELIREQFFAFTEADGKFDYALWLPEPFEAAAVWVSIDGDDTKSKFSVKLERLELVIEK